MTPKDTSKFSSTYDQILDRSEGPVVLHLDDEEMMRKNFQLAVKDNFPEGSPFSLLQAKTLEEAQKIISSQRVQVLLLDKDLGRTRAGEQLNGIKYIPQLLELEPSLQIVMLTGSKDMDDCVEAMKLGAFGFVNKGLGAKAVFAQVEKALHVYDLLSIKIQAQKEAGLPLELAGSSKAIRAVRKRLRAVAETPQPVLLLGEMGTGKTHSARMIHEYRQQYLKQTNRPISEVRLASIPAEDLEGELFGSDKGNSKIGYIEKSHNGTLFLDEIGGIPESIQVKLLRAIEEKKFKRIGSSIERSCHFKLICSTNRNLEQLVEEGKFREDFYLQISTFVLQMPSLKEREEDLPELIRALLPNACQKASSYISFEDLPKDFIDYLRDVPFRGNLKGLEQQLCRLLLDSPRDKQGQPFLQRWREIPGLKIKRSSPEAKLNSKTLSEFVSQNLDFNDPQFPGLQSFLEDLDEKIFNTALARLSKPVAVARALKLSEGSVSQRRKQLRLISKNLNEAKINSKSSVKSQEELP